MARSLAAMSVDALIKLRNEIGAVLNRKTDALKKELAAIGTDYAEVGRIAIYGRRNKKSALSGRKVPAKYRGPGGVTWAGRGAQPRWMREALKAGKKADDFLIAKPNGARNTTVKKARKARRKKR